MQNHPLTAARERLGLTRRQLADAVNKILYPDPGQAAHSAFTANYLGKLENGKIRFPAEDYRTALRIVLNVDTNDELGFRNPRTTVRQDAAVVGSEISAVSGNRRVVPAFPSVGSAKGLVEQPSVILARIRENNDASVNHALLDTLNLYVSDVVARYEEEGPLTLAADVVRQRRWVQSLIPLRMQPSYSARLLTIAGQLSGLLSYMSVNLGRFSSARAYGIEAFQLADYAEDRELKAWVRGTQSFAEFYDGQYRKALAYAVDGRRFASRGAQAVRLAVNGEARAHAKLGQAQEAEQAIGTAYEVLSDLSPDRWPPPAGHRPAPLGPVP
ncbi:helix-turn-helix domain-containing protein [Micromonospora sp. LOL_015]|uniref:helix-turn-helix domain-containing protein n=1 Tax=Micromonospora sp. LOL_015 TaxID=3345416 RepID=UPI003A8BA775